MAPGTAMREEMERKGKSYRDLAFLTDYSAPYLCRIAHGKRRPSKAAALAIAKALGVPPRRLWDEP